MGKTALRLARRCRAPCRAGMAPLASRIARAAREIAPTQLSKTRPCSLRNAAAKARLGIGQHAAPRRATSRQSSTSARWRWRACAERHAPSPPRRRWRRRACRRNRRRQDGGSYQAATTACNHLPDFGFLRRSRRRDRVASGMPQTLDRETVKFVDGKRRDLRLAD